MRYGSRVVVFAVALVAFVCALGGAGIARSQNIVFGADGNLWFTDGGVVRMTPRGVEKHFAFPGRLRQLQWRDIAAGPDGNLWLVGWSNVVMRLSPTGAVTTFPQGERPESCSECTAGRIVAGPDGNLWVGVADGNRIWRITPAGAVSTFVLPGVPESLNPGEGPDAMTAGPDGNVWFMRPNANRIGRISPSGAVQEFPVQIDKPGEPENEPGELTAGPDGNVWFTAPGPGRIGRITPAGVVTTFVAGVGRPVRGGAKAITTGPDGNVWFTAPEADRIGRMSPDGSVTLFRAPFGGFDVQASIRGITAGPDGNVWFSESARGRIARITPTGAVAHIPPTPVIGAVGLRGAGMAGVRLRCSAAAVVDCRGALSVDGSGTDGTRLGRVGQRRFSLAPGQAGTFRVRLTPTARRRLVSHRHVRLRIVAGPRLVAFLDPFPGMGGAVERRVTVRLPGTDSSLTGPEAAALRLRARQIVDAWVVWVNRAIPNALTQLRRSGWVTDALLAQAERAFGGGVAGSYDLLTCSQNPLPHYDLGRTSIVGGRGEVDVIGTYGAGPFVFTYEFVKVANDWKLDHVVCPTP